MKIVPQIIENHFHARAERNGSWKRSRGPAHWNLQMVPKWTQAARQAAEQVQTRPPKPVGLIASVKLLKDPDVQQTLQWITLTLKNFSRSE